MPEENLNIVAAAQSDYDELIDRELEAFHGTTTYQKRPQLLRNSEMTLECGKLRKGFDRQIVSSLITLADCGNLLSQQ